MSATPTRPIREAELAAFMLALGLALVAGACGSDSPVNPTPPPDNNAPPVISSVTAGSQRAEAGENVQVASVVLDSETLPDQLQYDWSAAPVNGTFTGTGRQVNWRAPFLQSPGVYTITLRVTENYTSNGVAKQNNVSSAVQVHYNDSYMDINRVSVRFLTELFPNFSLTGPQAVQDFSDSTTVQPDGSICADQKAAEAAQITTNRSDFHILSGTYTNIAIDLNAARTFADVFGTCMFVDIPQNADSPFYGKQEKVTGTCHLTAVYEQWKWLLCKSNFAGTSVGPADRYRVPGPVVSPAEAARWRRPL